MRQTPPSPKSYVLTFPTASWEQSLRALRGAVSRAAALILPQIKLNSQLSSCASFSIDTRLHHLKLWSPGHRSRSFWVSLSHPQPLTPILHSGQCPDHAPETPGTCSESAARQALLPPTRNGCDLELLSPLSCPKSRVPSVVEPHCPRVPNISPLRQQRRAQCKRERQDLSFKKQEKVFSLCSSVSLSAPDLVVSLCYWMLYPLSRPRDLPGWVQTYIGVRPHLEPHPQLSHRAPDRDVHMFMPQAWGRDSRWAAEKPCGVGREVERGGTECPRSGPLPLCQQGPLKTNSQKKLTSIPKGKPQSINPKGKKTDHLILK